ncbi:MAG: glycosyltransferase family 4 protein [Gammaproteobacteria bacterium]
MRILSPMPRGNGAWVVHQRLSQGVEGYRLCDVDPRWGFFPPALGALCAGSADIVHGIPDFAAYPLRARQRLVLTLHNYVLDPSMRAVASPAQALFYRWGLRAAYRRALGRAHAVTAVSRFTAQLLRSDLGFKGDVRVIYNGVDLRRFRPRAGPRSEGPLRVLFAANMSRRKGAHLLPAMAEALPSGIVIQYLPGLRGRGRLPDHPRLEPLGPVPYARMHTLYQQADMVLYPSFREGFGLVAAEAMACGLPVVASDNSSLPEVVDHGLGGFLCETGSVEAHLNALMTLADSPARLRDMGHHNRERAEERFDERDMFAAYRALFVEVVDATFS